MNGLNLEWLQWLIPFGGMLYEGEGEGGKDEGDKDKEGGDETVSKADYDVLKAANDKALADLETTRSEVLSDDYLAFLKNQGDKKDEGDKTPEIPEDAFEKMSKKEIYDAAVKAAEVKYQKDIKVISDNIANDRKSATSKEVDAFARTHEDYDTFRPIMYGLSTDPKNKDKSLQEIYDLAKDYGKKLPGTSEEQKKKQVGMSSEKPDVSSISFDKKDRKSDAEATAEAVTETIEKLGPLPSA